MSLNVDTHTVVTSSTYYNPARLLNSPPLMLPVSRMTVTACPIHRTEATINTTRCKSIKSFLSPSIISRFSFVPPRPHSPSKSIAVQLSLHPLPKETNSGRAKLIKYQDIFRDDDIQVCPHWWSHKIQGPVHWLQMFTTANMSDNFLRK